MKLTTRDSEKRTTLQEGDGIVWIPHHKTILIGRPAGAGRTLMWTSRIGPPDDKRLVQWIDNIGAFMEFAEILAACAGCEITGLELTSSYPAFKLVKAIEEKKPAKTTKKKARKKIR